MAIDREKEQALADHIQEYAVADIEGALQLLGGVFVGLNELYVSLRENDEQAKKDIIIVGANKQRKVTIHREAA